MGGDTHGSRTLLPAHPSSVPVARRTIREWLAGVGHAELAENAELAVSELVTNALVHAGTPVELVARLDVGQVRVEVGDGSLNLPRVRDYSTTSGTGRGLRLVERMVARWGAHRLGAGKVVWFELRPGEQQVEAVTGRTSAASEGKAPFPVSETSVVELLRFPLLLHAAWLEHAEALLREHLLVRLDPADAEATLEQHAAVSDALAVLVDQVPVPNLGEDPGELMAGAVEPFVTAERLLLHVPLSSVPHFQTLSRTLDEALAMAGDGLLLTPPTQPEVQAMRRWICGEVRRQTEGEPPLPWDPDIDPSATPDAAQIDWQRSAVDDSLSCLVAADDANRIVAVSGPALSYLGYGSRDEVVGRRLVALIPPRFRQAHLAGFTMHLASGRSPLLDRPITVPVLLADGSERLTELLVTAKAVPGERKLFVADLRPA